MESNTHRSGRYGLWGRRTYAEEPKAVENEALIAEETLETEMLEKNAPQENRLEQQTLEGDSHELAPDAEVLTEESFVEEVPAPAPETVDAPSAEVPDTQERLDGHPIVLIKGLRKKIGKVEALRGIDLALMEGHVLGLLGPNGSGKTTLLRILAGLAHPTDGRVEIDGVVPGENTKKIVSFLPDTTFLSNDMTVEKARRYYQKFFVDFDTARFNELVERLHLPEKTRLSRLSKGYRDRLSVSLVMSRRARLYLLDEPLGGVDPIVRDEVLDILVEAMGQDATLLITTHQVRDLERIFDEVCFLKEGRIVRCGPAESMREEAHADLDTVYHRIYGGVE